MPSGVTYSEPVMPKLGTSKRPAIVRVQDPQRAADIMALCDERGWKVIVGVEPHKAEDISDVEHLLSPPQPIVHLAKTGRNEPCPCGSGKKFKKCCLPLSNIQ